MAPLPGLDIDPITGLPKDLVSFEDVVKEQQKITVKLEKRRFNKPTTVISGIKKEANLGQVLKKLKEKFACGGTIRKDQGRVEVIELQGNHMSSIKSALKDLGFPEETIECRA